MRQKVVAALFLVLLSSPAHGGNTLSRAAISGDLESVKDAVKAGEKVNDIDKWGWTGLTWSIYYGNLPVTKWLLDHGANPNVKTEKDYGPFRPGTTPLIMAAYYGRDEAAAALLRKKADPRVADRTGKRAIDYAKYYRFDKIVGLLRGR